MFPLRGSNRFRPESPSYSRFPNLPGSAEANAVEAKAAKVAVAEARRRSRAQDQPVRASIARPTLHGMRQATFM